MPLFKKIKAKAKNCRGGGDDFAVKAFEEDYASWEAGIAEATEEQKEEIRTKFNAIMDDLGEAMLADEAEFKMLKADMTPEQTSNFVKALIPDYFELSAEAPAE